MSDKPIIFISYSHLDEPDRFLQPGEFRWLTYVRSFLDPAAAHGQIELWDDRQIDGGGDWKADIDQALERCAVCVFLVSRHSLSSRFILDVEMKRMLERHHARGAHLYPILITSTDLGVAPWLLKLNLKPTNNRALELYDTGPRNKVMSELAAEIRRIIERTAAHSSKVTLSAHSGASSASDAKRGEDTAVEPDIDAREAFFKILEASEWREQQIKTTDATRLIRDWLEVRLDTEVHRLLRNSKLDSWGEESLPGTQTTPEKPIPPEVWDKVEISFDRSALPRTAAHFKGQTRLTLGALAWVGVRFSSKQIFRLFPLNEGPSIDRIPCTELLEVASALGWDFTSPNSLHLLDLQSAMRQGGIDGTLTIWGRRNKWKRSESLMRNEVLEKIKPDHWAEFFVHLFAAQNADNFNVYSWTAATAPGAEFGERGYVDLHVERVPATSWLQRDAASFKGRTQKP